MIESAVLGRIAAPGAKAAVRVAGRLGYRQRVWWRVSRRSPIKIYRRAYARWLKSLDRETFDLPPEQAERHLAQAVLTAEPPLARWGPNKTDEAVFLIGDTWRALLGLGTPADVLERNEAWARARNVVTQPGPGAPIVSPFAVQTLSRRSAARTAVRLAAFELTDQQITELAASISAPPPTITPGQVHILCGPFGSGKSEMAERWHQAAIGELAGNWADAPFAVWLSARAIDQSLDATIADWIGRSEEATRRGADIVIDGLDETDNTRATELLEAAKIFLAGSPRSRILITAREITSGTTELSHPPQLEHQAVEQILKVVAGDRHSIYSLPAGVRDALRTPFFAVAAGSVLRNGRTVSGTARIIDELVGLALRRPLDAQVAVSPTLAPLLKTLAVHCTNSGMSVSRRDLRRDEIDQALKTRLITSDGERLTFSLPIFQQWFAAQAIIEDGADVDATAAAAFDRWRWSYALAASIAPPTVADQLLTTLSRSNPAATAWTVSNAVSNFYDPGLEHRPEYVNNAAARLASLYREVRSSLGALGNETFPSTADGDLATIGVRVSGASIARSWKVTSTDEQFVELPADISPFRHSPDWNGYRSATARPEACWLWTFPFDDLTGALDHLLITDQLPPDTTVWRKERLYSICRSIEGSRSGRHTPIPVTDLVTRIDQALHRGDAAVSFNHGPTLNHDELTALRTDLLAVPTGHVSRPWPTADLLDKPRGGGRFVGDEYSEELTRKLAFAIYTGAIEIYRTWATTWFAPFGWALGLLADPRIGLIGSVEFPERKGHPMPVPRIAYWVLPIAVLDRFVPTGTHLGDSGSPIRIGLTDGEPWPGLDHDTARTHLGQWMAQHGNPVFGGFVSGLSVLDVYRDRPATRLALQWLKADLNTIGLKANPRMPADW